MSVPFKTAPFKTAGGTSARSLSDWFGDVVNVKEMGATGNGSTDDTTAIQAALNRGFGAPGTPNGNTNKHLNKPVYFPTGRYKITAPLDLTKVVGGHIFGDSKYSSQIRLEAVSVPGGVPPWPVFNINGAAGLTMERLFITHTGSGGSFTGTKACCINLNWDGNNTGNGCDGLHGNHFSELQIGGGEWVVLIARGGYEGHNNIFVNCNASGGFYGYQVEGPNATNNMIFGGGMAYNSIAAVHCPAGGGSMHVKAYNTTAGSGSVDFRMHSSHQHCISGGRSESHQMLDMSAGVVIMQGITDALGGTVFANITGGKCIIEGCHFGSAGEITGTGGELYISGVYAPATTPLSGYSGTIKFNPQGLT